MCIRDRCATMAKLWTLGVLHCKVLLLECWVSFSDISQVNSTCLQTVLFITWTYYRDSNDMCCNQKSVWLRLIKWFLKMIHKALPIQQLLCVLILVRLPTLFYLLCWLKKRSICVLLETKKYIFKSNVTKGFAVFFMWSSMAFLFGLTSCTELPLCSQL